MLPYAGTPEFFTREEPQNAAPRVADETALSVRRSAMLPQPVEPYPDYQPYAILSSNPAVRQNEPNVPRTACVNSCLSSDQALPRLQDILMPELRNLSRGLSSLPAHTTQLSCERRYDETVCNTPSSLQYPLALHSAHSPPISHGTYAGLQNPRSDLSNVEIHPATPSARPLPPVLPNSTHHTAGTDHTEARQERPQRASLSSSKPVSSVYQQSPIRSEDYAHRTSNFSFEVPTYPQLATIVSQTPTRYLGIKNYPGQGTFHLYEDGYRIPTQVDGETVNPQWGLTKANKPRKRLALACLDCRDKKTKCEPGVKGCLQCVKAKRTCRQAPRDSFSNERDISLGKSKNSASSPHRSRTERCPDEDQSDLSFHHHAARHSNVLLDDGPPTRWRGQDEPLNSSALVDHDRTISRMPGLGGEMVSDEPQQDWTLEGQGLAVVAMGHKLLTSSDDPYAADPVLTMRLLDLYFSTVNNKIYCILPQNTFMRWLCASREKSLDTRMVLYAMLALGSLFAGQEYAAAGKRFSELAIEGLSRTLGHFSLGVAQTRLLLGLYKFAKGNEGAAWDYCGLAICAIRAMRYNDEEVCVGQRDHQDQTLEYGLTRQQLVECRRRTFWAGFLMDRYNGFRGELCIINSVDVHLRLPCTEESYESGLPSEAPFFNNGSEAGPNVSLKPSTLVSPMAWLIVVGGICGDTMNFICRAKSYSRSAYRETYEKVYDGACTALQEWSSSLPGHLRYNEANLDRSIQEGYADVFVSLHSLHHFVLMKLNRCIRHTVMPNLAQRNIRTAHLNARTLLSIICALRTVRCYTAYPEPDQPPRFSLSTPFPGYAILLAIDIVSAGAPDPIFSRSVEDITGGLACLHSLAPSWKSAMHQSRAAESRSLELNNFLTGRYKALPSFCPGHSWGNQCLREQEQELEDDCIYGVHDVVYFGALQEVDGS